MTAPRQTSRDSDAVVDLFIAHTDSEWQMASRLAQLLRDHGYTVARRGVLDSGREVLPADALSVIVIWPLSETLFPKLAFEARSAAQRGHLVHICAGQPMPVEDYGPPPVAFATWDYSATGPEWKALLRQLRPLCGAPPNPQVDLIAATPPAVIAVTVGAAVAGIFFALGQGWRAEQQQAAPSPAARDVSGDGPVRLAAEAPLVAPTVIAQPHSDGLGGPYEPAPQKIVIAPPPLPPEPAPVRAVQGPEQ